VGQDTDNMVFDQVVVEPNAILALTIAINTSRLLNHNIMQWLYAIESMDEETISELSL
jgi:hypothetical protein